MKSVPAEASLLLSGSLWVPMLVAGEGFVVFGPEFTLVKTSFFRLQQLQFFDRYSPTGSAELELAVPIPEPTGHNIALHV